MVWSSTLDTNMAPNVILSLDEATEGAPKLALPLGDHC